MNATVSVSYAPGAAGARVHVVVEHDEGETQLALTAHEAKELGNTLLALGIRGECENEGTEHRPVLRLVLGGKSEVTP